MLDRAMESQINSDEGEQYKQDYQERLEFLHDLFEGRPFRLPPDERGRERLSAAIYDASMVAINDLWDKRNTIEADKVEVQFRMDNAMSNDNVVPILTGQQNTANAVRERILLMRRILLPQ